jgi:hypothetical protein
VAGAGARRAVPFLHWNGQKHVRSPTAEKVTDMHLFLRWVDDALRPTQPFSLRITLLNYKFHGMYLPPCQDFPINLLDSTNDLQGFNLVRPHLILGYRHGFRHCRQRVCSASTPTVLVCSASTQPAMTLPEIVLFRISAAVIMILRTIQFIFIIAIHLSAGSLMNFSSLGNQLAARSHLRFAFCLHRISNLFEYVFL